LFTVDHRLKQFSGAPFGGVAFSDCDHHLDR